MPKRYVNIKLPVELGDEVDRILERKLFGYRSRAEFVAEVVRDSFKSKNNFQHPERYVTFSSISNKIIYTRTYLSFHSLFMKSLA
jgi:metal-responsive CopG/Arc/MetJ family transcriptional regulator